MASVKKQIKDWKKYKKEVDDYIDQWILSQLDGDEEDGDEGPGSNPNDPPPPPPPITEIEP